MRILIALTYYRPHYSGLTIHAEREALALVARNHQVTILTSRFDNNLPADEIKDGVRIIRPKVWFSISKGVIMPNMPFWAWKLVRQAEVVHLHAPQLDAAPIAVVCRLLGKPMVLTYHCDLRLPAGAVHWLANQASDLANRVTASIASVIVHNTLDYAQHSRFLKSYLDKLYTILPPVEVTQVTASEIASFQAKFHLRPEERLIGMAARLATEKGVEYLAEALPIVLQKHPTARVLFVGPYQNVVGEEEYANRLTPLIEELGDHWSFLGVISPVEMAAFFRTCEVTVLPSINPTESYGLVQVESMICGTPVVASDLPGVRVPIRKTGMGCTVPARNASALAQALIEVLNHPQGYRKDPTPIAIPSTPDYVAAEYEKTFELAKAGHLLPIPQEGERTDNFDLQEKMRQEDE
jgi:glycosyltransferase involved in cell wall biosynthesis